MEPLLDSAEAGHIVLLWSPSIINEASKVLLWIWLQKRGGHITSMLKREAFDVARRWFLRMTTVFHVVEDRPPYAPQWSESPHDENDRPVWTAAVNGRAHVVLTANLKDGPPVDSDGFRTWGEVIYFHPDEFVEALDRVGHSFETMTPPQFDEDHAPFVDVTATPAEEGQFSPEVLRFLRAIEQRAQDELPPAELSE